MAFFGAFVGGWAGWLLASGAGLTAAFIVSSVGTIGGTILGWYISERYLT